MNIRLFAAVLGLVLTPTLAFAESADNGSCTDAAKSTWLSVDAIKAKAGEAGLTDIKKVKVEGTCYEVYAYRNGKKAEVMFNPATGAEAGSEMAD